MPRLEVFERLVRRGRHAAHRRRKALEERFHVHDARRQGDVGRRLEEAELELDNFSVNKQPTEDFLSEGLGQDVFHAEEIDQMEWADLDDMELEELKAYKDKIVKTLKEIKAQEQQWKTRVTKLLDMKEEAEGLIEDLE